MTQDDPGKSGPIFVIKNSCRMQRHRLVGHLAVRYFIISLAALMVFGWWGAQAFDSALTRSAWTELEAAANLAASEVGPHLAPGEHTGAHSATTPSQGEGGESAADGIAARIAQSTRTRITVVLPDGRVLLDTDTRTQPQQMGNHAARPEVAAALAGNIGRNTRWSETRNEQTMYVAVPLKQEGKMVAVVRAAKSAADLEPVYHDAQRSLLAGMVVVGAIAGLVGWWLAKRSAAQLQPLVEGAELMSEGQRMPKLPLPEIVELATLAAALNQIARQLDERSLRIGQQGHQQEAVLASMVEGVLAVDSEQRVITLNSAAARLIGSPHADLHGRNLQEVLRNADLRRFVARALQSPDPIEDDVVLHGEGARILQVRGTALRDAAGRGVGAVIVLNDVTRYRHLENLRRDFVANVSHELKTPIASIKGFVETLLDGALAHPDDAQRFLKIVASHAERLNNIIEDLLSLSKIEQSEQAANLPLALAPLRGVLEAALHACQPHAAARNIQLSLLCDDALLARFNPPLLEEAIINLVDNAIKYSEPGRQVSVTAQVAAQQNIADQNIPDQTIADQNIPDENGALHEISIAVRDQGCGIAPEHLPRLFERFYRVDRARSRKLGGTGLGLAIVKHIVQAHRGHVSVSSTPGEGSVFCIHLPLAAAALETAGSKQ
jgi:two-component system phosphate regulon sensor histidine kinase PhoR